ncbi:MAG TPA: hypothetical protein VMZ31_02750 [Phycisphaerae bacterium]|nr:hypothetical protein [Phycisphaerae bacterium]
MDLDELFACKVDLPADPNCWDFTQLPSHGGTWLICGEDERPIQLASCQNLRRSIGARLGRSERPRSRADLTAIARRLRWQPGFSAFENTLHYWRTCRRLYPRRYRKMLGFGPAWFVQADTATDPPELVTTNMVYARGSPTLYLGPIATRRDCSEYVDLLHDLFDLCRHHDRLRQRRRGQACAYHEMERCVGVCLGAITMAQYRQVVDRAVAFARGRRAPTLEKWRREMSAAAEEMQFEQAARIKRRLEQADRLSALPFRHMCDAQDFNWLIIQPGGGTSWVKPFFVDRGWIRAGEAVRLRDLDGVVGHWQQALDAAKPAESDDPVVRAEQVWLVAHFLFKQQRDRGLYFRADELPAASELLDVVRSRFRSKRGAASDAGGEISERHESTKGD